MGLHEALIATWFDKTFFRANGRMLSKDPVKRGLDSYRYCDNDPADYVDPTGEVAHILWGIGLGGAFGFGGGFLSSAVSQKASGGKIDWKEALGSGINGLITGATQGGLLASGAGIPAALFANTLAGTAGSAAEQYIGSGKIDARKSITSGLNNAVSNAIYGTRPLGSMKEAFGRGVGAGAATSALNYISDTLGEKTLHSRMGMGLLSGMTGAAFSPYNFLRNPRRGCGSPSPFVPSLGYGSARGYQYDLPKIENGSQSQTKKFSLGDFLREVAIGGVTGGLSSAAFYGAGKGIERLKDGLRPKSYMTGHDGELALAKMYKGDSQIEFNTSRGRRVVDQLSKGIAHESKVGYQSLSQGIRKQVLKDAELVANHEIAGAHWHFFRSGVTGKVGATPQLLDFLTKNGIKYTIH